YPLSTKTSQKHASARRRTPTSSGHVAQSLNPVQSQSQTSGSSLPLVPSQPDIRAHVPPPGVATDLQRTLLRVHASPAVCRPASRLLLHALNYIASSAVPAPAFGPGGALPLQS